jgi:hypothetical protein
MQKKKEIPIMELRAEPLKEVTMNLPEEYVLLKLKFLNNVSLFHKPRKWFGK